MTRYYETFGSEVSETSRNAYRLIIKDLAPGQGTDDFWALSYLSEVRQDGGSVALYPEPNFYIGAVLADQGPVRLLSALRSDLITACETHLLPEDNELLRMWREVQARQEEPEPEPEPEPMQEITASEEPEPEPTQEPEPEPTQDISPKGSAEPAAAPSP